MEQCLTNKRDEFVLTNSKIHKCKTLTARWLRLLVPCFGYSGSSKRRRKEELLGKPFRRPQHELDSNGLVPLPVKVCYTCNR